MPNQENDPQKTSEHALVGNQDNLKALMLAAQSSIADIVPKHLTAEHILKMVLIAASRNPQLFECTRLSILQSTMRSAELGLDCGGALGEGYLIPFRNTRLGVLEAQFIPGYRGLIKLARNSGKLVSLAARVVREGEHFQAHYGTTESIEHTPQIDGDELKPLRCVYAVAHLTDGSYQIEVMPRAQIERTRRRSKAATNGPWVTDYDEMARKSAVRLICKYLPLSPEMEKALGAENEAESRPEYVRISGPQGPLDPAQAANPSWGNALVEKLRSAPSLDAPQIADESSIRNAKDDEDAKPE